jgi:hypothetical protein
MKWNQKIHDYPIHIGGSYRQTGRRDYRIGSTTWFASRMILVYALNNQCLSSGGKDVVKLLKFTIWSFVSYSAATTLTVGTSDKLQPWYVAQPVRDPRVRPFPFQICIPQKKIPFSVLAFKRENEDSRCVTTGLLATCLATKFRVHLNAWPLTHEKLAVYPW